MSTLKYSDFKINPIFPEIITSKVESLEQKCTPHLHLDYDITFVTSGILKLQLGDSTRFYHEGQFCLLNPATVQHGEGVGDKPLSIKNIKVSPAQMLQVMKLNNPENTQYPVFDSSPIFDRSLNQIFQRFFDLLRADTSQYQALSDEGWRFLQTLVNYASFTSSKSSDVSLDLPFEIRIMKDKVREKLKIPELAQKMNLSEHYFIKKFKRLYGITPYHFFMQLKLETAFRELLKQQEIQKVAYDFGYSDQAHFTRLIKKYYGYNPRAIGNLLKSHS
ncbi:transcriptional regulator [Vibrio sagamiensis NBRC 104589]|uniref:Transcriptional regulator n=2 Tax=Vibrio sagamiensis TaxID=512650 RepID=A0A511QCV4_9VIBR|nr:transcriptional regulator [Vibrio sagamiensis NBRC 104589]